MGGRGRLPFKLWEKQREKQRCNLINNVTWAVASSRALQVFETLIDLSIKNVGLCFPLFKLEDIEKANHLLSRWLLVHVGIVTRTWNSWISRQEFCIHYVLIVDNNPHFNHLSILKSTSHFRRVHVWTDYREFFLKSLVNIQIHTLYLKCWQPYHARLWPESLP